MFNFNRKDDDMFAEYYASKAENSTATEEERKGFSPEEYLSKESKGKFGDYRPDEEPTREKDAPVVSRRLYRAMVCIYTVLLILFSIGNYYNARQIKQAKKDLQATIDLATFYQEAAKNYKTRIEEDDELIAELQEELALYKMTTRLDSTDTSNTEKTEKPNPSPTPTPSPSLDNSDPSPIPPNPDPPEPYPEDLGPKDPDAGVKITPNDDQGPGPYQGDA